LTRIEASLDADFPPAEIDGLLAKWRTAAEDTTPGPVDRPRLEMERSTVIGGGSVMNIACHSVRGCSPSSQTSFSALLGLGGRLLVA